MDLDTFANRILKNYAEWMGYVRDRWEDEKEYEDWSEYVRTIKAHINGEEEFYVSKVNKRPFTISIYNIPLKETFLFIIKANGITVKAMEGK